MKALDVCSLVEVGGNLLPVLGSELPDEPGQSEVLLVIPVPFGVLSRLAVALILIRLKCLIICIIVGVCKIIYVGLVHEAFELSEFLLVARLLRLIVFVALRLRLPVIVDVPRRLRFCSWIARWLRTGKGGGVLQRQRGRWLEQI